MKIVKTASGKWTALAYAKDAKGAIHRKRFTSSSKFEVRDAVAEFERIHRNEEVREVGFSFYDAAKKYIDSRRNIISPSTLENYESYVRIYATMWEEMDVHEVTAKVVQEFINEKAKTVSPKTVRNIHGFISAVLKEYAPETVLRTKLPQKVKPQLYTPNSIDIRRLLEGARGTRMEIPIMLAAFCSLRRSEICALYSEDITDTGIVYVNKALVRYNGDLKEKTTKTVAGTRITPIPLNAVKRIRELVPSGKITDMTPAAITDEFPRLLKRIGLPHFRFHALRSFYATYMHHLGFTDQVTMLFGGWEDKTTMQTHYQRVLTDDIMKLASSVASGFDELLEVSKK